MQMCPEQLALLKEIMKVQFALVETALYLDTHPQDPRVLGDHNQLSCKLDMLKRQYEQKYQPLTHYGMGKFPWNYLDGPWPWEIQY